MSDPLALLGARPVLRLDHHRGTHRIGHLELAPGAKGALAGSQWQARLESRPLADGGCELRAVLRCTAGTLPAATASLCLDLPWSRQAYLCVPAAVYAGNRFRALRLPYPPMFAAEDRRIDLAPTITDVPRLELGEGESRFDLMSADCTAPAFGLRRPDGVAAWLLAPPATRLGQTSLHAEESPARDRLRLRWTAPGLREDVSYAMINTARPSHDRAADVTAGDEIELVVRVQAWPDADILALLRHWPDLLLGHGDLGAHPPQLPFSAAFDIQQAKYDGNWGGDYYRLGMGSSPYEDWQSGWCGGGLATLPLLADGTETHRHRALRNLDWLVGPGQGPSGFFRGIINKGVLYGDGFGQPGTEHLHLVRKSGDVLLFLAKQLAIARRVAPGHPGLAAWRDGLARCAEAFVRVWRAHGQFGHFVDDEDGRLVVGGSASGAIVPGGLALAAAECGRPDWLALAREAVAVHHQRWVAQGLSTGGPGEILQCPDAESAFALVESAALVAEATGIGWELAADAAALASTWVFASDFPFPANSTFARLDMRSRGSVWANAQNKHSAPGICTLSGDCLLRLARASGDRRWLDLLRGIAHSLPQYLSRADRPVKDLPPGWMCERVNTCDWEREWCPPGEVFRGSCWCEVSLMLSHAELPGVYWRRDRGEVAVLDHVQATLLDDGRTLELRNPTAYGASVRVLAEDAAGAARPLGLDAAARWPRLRVPAGGSLRWRPDAGVL